MRGVCGCRCGCSDQTVLVARPNIDPDNHPLLEDPRHVVTVQEHREELAMRALTVILTIAVVAFAVWADLSGWFLR